MSSATAALLWAACRPSLDVDAVTAALDAGADVDFAAQLASAHRVAPLLARSLGAVGVDIPGFVREDATRCRAQARILLPMVSSLALTPLHDAGLTPLVIKGGALASRYAEPGLRPMDDVDVIVPADQVDATNRVLRDTGWTRSARPIENPHELTLAHDGVPGLTLDLHWEWASVYNRADHLLVADLWDARTPQDMFGATAYGLPPEIELVMLAAHAGKPYHGFDRLLWIADIGVVAANTKIDWDRVDEFATRTRCRTKLAVALALAAHIGVEAPDRLRTVPPAQRDVLEAVVSADWPVTPRTPRMRRTLRYALVDNRRLMVRLAWGEVFVRGVGKAPRRAVRLVRHRYERDVALAEHSS